MAMKRRILVGAGGCCLAVAIAARTAFADVPPVSAADEADVTWRIPCSVWMDDAAFAELMRLFTTNRLTGKIAFFTAEVHCPVNLQEMLRRAELLKPRIAEMHRLGYVAGINHLSTLGHFDECIAIAEDVKGARRFTNRHGKSGKVQYCPADPLWRGKYLGPCYRALAGTGADFIWTDDDIRLRNHGVPGGGCFCDGCMKRIRARFGYEGGREGLEGWLSDPVEGMARRRAFLQYNRDTLADLYAFIARTIHSVAPKMDIGVMDSATTFWHGMPFDEIFSALKTPSSDVYWRPGGGFYLDARPDSLLSKANTLAAEAARLPKGVRRIEGELENFLYQRVGKSEHFTALEGMLYVALGLNGVAYNVFSPTDNEGFDAYASLVRHLELNRPAYAWTVAAAGREPCRGIWTGDGERDIYAGATGGDWLDVLGVGSRIVNSELQAMGFPVAYRFEDAVVFAPTPEAIRTLPKERLERMLSAGVYLDVLALEALALRGYGADAGFTLGRTNYDDLHERFTEHPAINGELAGRERNARQKFFHIPGVRMLEPLPGAEPLSVYVGEDGVELKGACAMGVFVNRFGGRVCVNAYAPWLNTSFRSKRLQLGRMFRWLAKGRLPGLVRGTGRLALWVRGRRAAVLFNMSQDAARDVDVEFADVSGAARFIVPPSVAETRLTGKADGSLRVFRIPELPPWSLAILQFLPDE